MRTVTLGDYIEILSGFAFKSSLFNSEARGLPLVRIRDVVPGYSETYSDEDFDEKYLLEDGDLLIGMDGEFNCARWKGGKALLNQRVCRVIASSKNLDDQYLFYFLPRPLKQIEAKSNFVTVKHLSVKQIQAIKIPLPPLEEQRRIAAILDKADGVRRKRKEAIRLTEELLKSTFLEMFGDPVTNPKGWEKIKLGNLCTIVRGGSPRPINDYLGGSIPWIKIGDATEGDDIYIHKTAEAIKPDGVKKSRYLEPGSLIFANCGVSLGFARILKIAGCIHDGWLAFSDLDKSINQIFLLKLLNSITEHFRAIAPAGTQPNLNTKIMKNFEIPIPPIDLQEKFAVVSHYLTDIIQKNSEMFKESENLFNSLLQRAFRGEL
ncbi:MAG: restriction endonuclease subunit S [Microcystis sp. M048S1]|uniref:restriction endonuclease subunit S n=1 Tax=unclassified Microcystis TaxID=2643300 RepID=UPI00119437D6|nr:MULTISPECIES: restriction endonuclease subunit S [unclassified Microcystis]MCA2900505.1 restriction endonuclease subunit S [Microcystis sp. M035S1]MCA2720774.1 restriction endonuclease subunit S [Microcystis sp. M176S2]MCA2725114.1 restriction endonuclease subunit S [Microcystis sp. M166S2]MCA2729542.1 restriction endonuclease subunit S [Microcystis sp. M162S2]MCA2748424.1 restriction endonuclease subunit S [Microcystis sp. M155S2]